MPAASNKGAVTSSSTGTPCAAFVSTAKTVLAAGSAKSQDAMPGPPPS
jgi:hypothetical protein